MTRRVFLLPAAALLAAVGCSRPPEPVKVYPVRGQVVYNGKPAAGVRVVLFPTGATYDGEIPANPHGETGPDGRFTLTTYADGDGAPEGGYRVVLQWPPDVTDGDGEEEGEEDRLLGWYSVVNTQLTADIKPGENELPPFKLPAKQVPPEQAEGIPGMN